MCLEERRASAARSAKRGRNLVAGPPTIEGKNRLEALERTPESPPFLARLAGAASRLGRAHRLEGDRVMGDVAGAPSLSSPPRRRLARQGRPSPYESK